jgi:hypothetical protein
VSYLKEDVSGEYFESWWYVPAASVEMWRSGKLQKITFTDAAHATTQVGGTMFTVSAVDAGRHIVPLVIGFSIHNESSDTWKKCFEIVRDNYAGYNEASTVDISDADKGLLKAHKDVVEMVKHFMCTRHRGVNVVKNTNAACGDAYHRACNAKTMANLASIKDHFPVKLLRYITQIPDEMQFPVALGGLLRGWSTQSVAESLNAAWLAGDDVRHQEPAAMCTKVILETWKMQLRNAEEADKHNKHVPPKVAKFYDNKRRKDDETNKLKDRAESLTVELMPNAMMAAVTDPAMPGAAKHFTNLEDGTCTCGIPARDDRPLCMELYAHAQRVGYDLTAKVKELDTTTCWKAQYMACKEKLSKMPPATALLLDVADDGLKPPAAAPRQRGRKAEGKRHISFYEKQVEAKKKVLRLGG